MRSAVHCRVTYRYECPACDAAEEVLLRVAARDPLLPPQHFLPARWHLIDGQPLCPQHTLRFEESP